VYELCNLRCVYKPVHELITRVADPKAATTVCGAKPSDTKSKIAPRTTPENPAHHKGDLHQSIDPKLFAPILKEEKRGRKKTQLTSHMILFGAQA
jgi:hypothetical protein